MMSTRIRSPEGNGSGPGDTPSIPQGLSGSPPAGEGHASIAGRVRDLIGPAPRRRPGTPTGSAPLAREIWQPSDPSDRYTLR